MIYYVKQILFFDLFHFHYFKVPICITQNFTQYLFKIAKLDYVKPYKLVLQIKHFELPLFHKYGVLYN